MSRPRGAMDKKTKDVVTSWIQQILNKYYDDLSSLKLSQSSMQSDLKNGILLCKLANAIQPGTVKHVLKPSNIPYKQMETISFFTKACKSVFYIPDKDVFGTVDLFNDKDMNQVFQCLLNLGIMTKEFPEFKGPFLKYANGQAKVVSSRN